MARLIHRRIRLKRRERGFAMIVIISLIVLISSYLIANALSRTGAELSIERERRSMDALRQAKAALIAYAASEQWQLYKSQVTNQPGGLPCPDLDDDGASEGLCSNALRRVGRLPWTTIGADDLRDASGERLWYAVSSNFRKLSGTTVINSDTQGLLTVTGTAPANNVVAIVFAPGTAIQGQNRDPANAATHNAPASYLEGFTAGATDYTFTTNALPSDTFNDRLLVITQADLMAAVEPVVAARIERDIKPYLQTYFNEWGVFPFPAAFANPDPGTSGTGTTRPQSAYVGDPTQLTGGLLPVTSDTNYMTWSVTVQQLPNNPSPYQSTGFVVSTPCDASASPVTCTVNYLFGRPRIRLTATAPAGRGFARRIQDSDISGSLTNAVVKITTPTLDANGMYTITYEGRVPGGSTTLITIEKPSYYTLTSTSDPAAGWFIANEWYRQLYYAVSPGHLPGGGGPCNPLPGTPSCLTVGNLPPVTYPTANDKRAILVFAGRALDGSMRPSSSLSNYLEEQNSTPADFTYEHRQGAPTSINDRVVVLAP